MASKYQEIAALLRRQIAAGEYPPGAQLPTEQALCQTFGVSRQTIRQSLACLVKEGLIERRQGSGSRVLDRSAVPEEPMPQRTIAVITTYISDYIFPSILREAEAVLSVNNCSPLLFATKNQVSNERRVLQSLLTLPNLDGALVEGTKTALPNPNLDLYRKLQDRGIPLVFMNGNYQELTGAVAVLDDNYGGGYQLVNYLAEKGHTRIAGIFKSDDIQGHQRYAGYAAALRDHGLPLEDDHLFWYSTETKGMLHVGSPISEELQNRVLRDCTAVVCYNDEIASYLLQSLQHSGIRVPADLAVVSFDNSRYSDLSAIRITSLSHGSQNVGRLAAETLIRLLSGQPCESQFAPWQLVEKESS